MSLDAAGEPWRGRETWQVRTLQGEAEALHAATAVDLRRPMAREVRVYAPSRPTVILGSTQDADQLDRDFVTAHGLEVARRKSGGSAVMVGDGASLWVDLLLPRDDPLWVDDVSRSALWLGEVWERALGSLGVEARAWPGPMLGGAWSQRICFAGLAPGEVLAPAQGRSMVQVVDFPADQPAGAKLVGVSQRRGRYGCAFQCSTLLRWEPWLLLGALGLSHNDPPARCAVGVEELWGPSAPPVGGSDTHTSLLSALLGHLPGR